MRAWDGSDGHGSEEGSCKGAWEGQALVLGHCVCRERLERLERLNVGSVGSVGCWAREFWVNLLRVEL